MSNHIWLNSNVTSNDRNLSTPNTSLDDSFTNSEVTAMQLCHILLGLVGVLENLGVIVLILHNRRIILDYSANWFVLNMAVSDLVACLITVCFVNIAIIHGKNFAISAILFRFVVLSGTGNLFILTFNRFLSVFKSLRYSAYMTVRRAKRLVLIPWIMAFVLCVAQWYSYRVMNILNNFVGGIYYGALTLSIVVLNVYLLKTARDKMRDIKTLTTAAFGRNAAPFIKEYRLLIRLFIVTLTFFASSVPLMVIMLLYQSKEARMSTSFQRKFVWIAVVTLLNTIIDPLVYSTSYPLFTKYFKKTQNRFSRRNRTTPRVLFRKDDDAVEIYFLRQWSNAKHRIVIENDLVNNISNNTRFCKPMWK